MHLWYGTFRRTNQPTNGQGNSRSWIAVTKVICEIVSSWKNLSCDKRYLVLKTKEAKLVKGAIACDVLPVAPPKSNFPPIWGLPLSSDQSYFVIKVIDWFKLSSDKIYHVIEVRDGWSFKNGWIFGKIPNGLCPHLRKTISQFFSEKPSSKPCR